MTLVQLLAGIRHLLAEVNEKASERRMRPVFDMEDFNLEKRSNGAYGRDYVWPTVLEMRVKHASGKIFVIAVREE